MQRPYVMTKLKDKLDYIRKNVDGNGYWVGERVRSAIEAGMDVSGAELEEIDDIYELHIHRAPRRTR